MYSSSTSVIKLDDYRMYNVTNYVTYLGIPAHILFIPLFFYLGYDFLAYANFLSVGAWVYARKLNQEGKLGYAISILIIEVILHSFIATILLGPESGFQYYLFGLVPFSMFHQKLTNRGFAFLAITLGLTYISSIFIAYNISHHVIDALIMDLILYSNIVIVFTGISLTSFYFRKSSLELENELLNTVNEREILIKEVHHRVKNNMQIIISLLHLQGDKYDNETAEQIINSTELRINAMLLVHEKLFQGESLSSLSVMSYLEALSDDLKYNLECSEDIIIVLDCDDIVFNLDRLIPIGLIVNEVLTNNCKYADFDKNASITISLHQKKDKYILCIKDNGQTAPSAYEREGSIGIDLISGLVKSKLKGTSKIYFDEGTVVEIIF